MTDERHDPDAGEEMSPVNNPGEPNPSGVDPHSEVRGAAASDASVRPLGRRHPPDWDHISKYPLDDLRKVPDPEFQPDPENPVHQNDVPTVDLRPVNVPVAIGVNWYTAFDEPVAKSSGGHTEFWIPDSTALGSIRGGHCVCLEPALEKDVQGQGRDNPEWYEFYNQGQEGACEGFAHSRMMSLLNRHRYDAWWLYDKAREIDGDTDPDHEGTTNRACLEVLKKMGHVLGHGKVDERTTKFENSEITQGIAAYRWARSADEVLHALGTPDLDYVIVLNSWGKDYPHRVKMSANVLQRLLHEAGEAGVVTDR